LQRPLAQQADSAGMRQGYCWYLSVSLLVVAFNVSAVAMIVCEKPDAKGANTERCHLYSD